MGEVDPWFVVQLARDIGQSFFDDLDRVVRTARVTNEPVVDEIADTLDAPADDFGFVLDHDHQTHRGLGQVTPTHGTRTNEPGELARFVPSDGAVV